VKRVIVAIVGTVAGLVGLLDFKSHGMTTSASGALPSAGLPGSSTSTVASGSTGSGPTPSGATGSPTTPKSSPSSAGGASGARSATGSAAQTPYGVIQVKVTVSGSKITNVNFVQLQAFDGHSQQINSYSAPILLRETLAKQTARVDTVSGASYTSDGYRRSLQSALDQLRFKG
jgi:uncharacterized protein with FMN-binding domain